MFKRQDLYAAKVKVLYDQAVNRLLTLAMQMPEAPVDGEAFSFADNPRIANETSQVIRQLYSQVYQQIKHGVEAEWDLANLSCDKIITDIFGAKIKEANLAARWFERNKQAMDQFFARTQADGGLNLSQRVWKYTSDLRGEMENALSVAMGEGESAATMSRRVRQYLREPDKLFRRVRGSDGKLRLSKAAQLYHPGQGVYRSSCKNAMRLARTETNAAYRAADEDRWSRMDFVVGFEVKKSNNHPETDMCDELCGKYPKGFKFTAWHPQCRCFVVPILATPQEMVNMQKSILAGDDVSTFVSANQVTSVPPQFTNWITDNQDRILRAKSVPYFIRDNFVGGDITKGLTPAVLNAGLVTTAKHPVPTIANVGVSMPTDKQAIKSAVVKSLSEVEMGDALRSRADALSAALKGDDMEAIKRAYDRVMAGIETQKKWDAMVWQGFTQEQKANLQEFAKAIGMKKGRPMTHDEANVGRCNPDYAKEQQFKVNCQTCVPVYMLRRWGFNVEALGNKNGSVWKVLRGGFTDVWKNPKGEIGFGLRFRGRSTKASKMYEWLEAQPDGIYQIECIWKGGRSGHTWCYVKKDGKGYMYDPQMSRRFDDAQAFKRYSDNVSPKYGYNFFRIDDLRINVDAMKQLVKEHEDKLSVEQIARKRHAARDAEAIKKAWRKRLVDNANEAFAQSNITEASDALNARVSAFKAAIKADNPAAIAREYKRVLDGIKAQSAWEQRVAEMQKIEQAAAKVLTGSKYKEIDTTDLEKLMRYRMHKAQSEIAKLQSQLDHIEQVKAKVAPLIPDADKWLKQFTSADIEAAYDAIESKMAQWAHLPIEEQEKKLLFEIKFVEDPSKYKAGATQYPTWKISQEAYARKLTEVQDKIWWKQKDAEYQDLLQYKISTKTKSKKLAEALQQYQEAVAVGDKLKAAKAMSDASATKASLEKAAATRAAKRGTKHIGKDIVLPDISSEEAERLIAAFEAEYGETADSILRKMTEADWKRLTQEQRLVLTKYTQTYSYLNEPLRGIRYYASKTKDEFNHDMPTLTEALSKQRMPQNTVVRRGTGDFPIKALGKNLGDVQPGDEFVDGAFLSTAVRVDKGFHETYNLVIVVPKGAQGMYVEPFSHYTDSLRFDYSSNRLWDGVTKESMGGEREWVGQRGSKFRVLRKKGNTIYLQMIGQLYDQVADASSFI